MNHELFLFNVDSKRKTFWQKLIPRTRLVCVLLIVLAIALTPNGYWWTWSIYAIGIAIAVLISKVNLMILLKRLAIESAFLGTLLIGNLFHDGGEILWQWGWLKISTDGLIILGSVGCKTILSLILLNVLTLTTSIPSLLQALISLKTPPLLVAILASMYRYIGVLIEESNSMKRAAMSRNLLNNKRWQRLVLGNAIGGLFIRTYDRGERVYLAMLSRGYQGLPPTPKVFKTQKHDLMALFLTVLLALLGQAVYLKK
jgi:cobalt/nickel transport system permease protein